MRSVPLGFCLSLLSTVVLVNCADLENAASTAISDSESELGPGDVEGFSEALTTYKYATTCKPIPALTPLAKPSITVSLDGLTLHLKDLGGTFDKVYKVGPGQLEGGKSLTPTSTSTSTGTFYTGTSTTEVKDSAWGYYYPCRFWWTDPDTGNKSPVFAGLPFIRLQGPSSTGYGIHGPIDNYDTPSGGTLRRGYVSHGCMRMEAADIVEVYALIKGRSKTPVKVQQEIERRDDGTAVDVSDKWVGAECKTDAECNYTGGSCHVPSGATIGTCTASCTKTCADKTGEATTFCQSMTGSSTGRCVLQASTTYNDSCRRYRGRLDYENVTRPDKSKSAYVCSPD